MRGLVARDVPLPNESAENETTISTFEDSPQTAARFSGA